MAVVVMVSNRFDLKILIKKVALKGVSMHNISFHSENS